MTKTEQIREHLRKYGQISNIEAKEKYGIDRTSSIIFELRSRQGWIIESQSVFGNGKIPHRVIYILREKPKCKRTLKKPKSRS